MSADLRHSIFINQLTRRCSFRPLANNHYTQPRCLPAQSLLGVEHFPASSNPHLALCPEQPSAVACQRLAPTPATLLPPNLMPCTTPAPSSPPPSLCSPPSSPTAPTNTTSPPHPPNPYNSKPHRQEAPSTPLPAALRSQSNLQTTLTPPTKSPQASPKSLSSPKQYPSLAPAPLAQMRASPLRSQPGQVWERQMKNTHYWDSAYEPYLSCGSKSTSSASTSRGQTCHNCKKRFCRRIYPREALRVRWCRTRRMI